MRLCRFRTQSEGERIGIVNGDSLMDLIAHGIASLLPVLEENDPAGHLRNLDLAKVKPRRLSEITLLAPVEQQEVWAAGVTYLRSRTARMEESDFSATAYDRVYDAERPELFFKSLPQKVVPTGGTVGIRRDSKWNVPEPELALVLN